VPSPDPAAIAKARILFGHAALQRVADVNAVDVLHIKGYAIHPSLTRKARVSTDVDVIVRPSQVDRLMEALQASGWEYRIGFESGSPFGHAATLHHELWGYADIHRHIPGIAITPTAAFDRLWNDRGTTEIAGWACPVPSLTAQRVLVLLHAARSEHRIRAEGDTELAWGQATDDERRAARGLVQELSADVAFAAALGELERFKHRREYGLWRSVSEGGTRTGEWWGRIVAAGSLRASLHLLLRAPLVNVEHLAAVLGRPPRRLEIVREFFARPLRGIAELARLGPASRRASRE